MGRKASEERKREGERGRGRERRRERGQRLSQNVSFTTLGTYLGKIVSLQQQVERSGNSILSVDALIVDLGKQKRKQPT